MSDDRSDLEEAIRLLRWYRASLNYGHQPEAQMATDALLARHPEKPKLLGCPFCGGVPELSTPQKGYGSMRRGYCHNCQVYGPWGTDTADATAAWNRRAPSADLICALDLLKEYLNEGAIPHDEVIDLVAKYPATPVGGLQKDKQ